MDIIKITAEAAQELKDRMEGLPEGYGVRITVDPFPQLGNFDIKDENDNEYMAGEVRFIANKSYDSDIRSFEMTIEYTGGEFFITM